MINGKFDVTIVGYGPVGKVLGILLARKGWSVAIFERWETPYELPRAVHFDQEIQRILEEILGAEEVLKVAEPVNDWYEWYNNKEELLLRIDWTKSSFFSQPLLERELAKHCEKLPNVELFLGYEATKLQQNDESVLLTLEKFPQDQQQQALQHQQEQFVVESKYIVGCDGANSFVREELGFEVNDLGFSYDWLIVDIVPHEKREWKPKNSQICDPERPRTIVSGGYGRRRWEFMRLPHETLEYINSTETAWELIKPWDIHPGNATLERHAVYTFRAKWLENWRKGRALLAGDAAHLMPPFYGQGMCSGLRDAKNLAWKLGLVLAGKAEESLLDTYEEERKPHVKSLIEDSVYLGKMICQPDPEEARKRDEKFLTNTMEPFPEFPHLVGGILSQKGHEKVGQLSPYTNVYYKNQTMTLEEAVGDNWLLLTTKPINNLLSEEHKSMLRDLNVTHIDLLNENADIEDFQRELLNYLHQLNVETLIIRPDLYIYGSTKEFEELPVLLDELQTQLKIKVQGGVL